MTFGRLLRASALFSLAMAANKNNAGTATSNGDNAALTLDSNAVQTGSFFDGQDGIGAEAGEAVSTTSQNNFINFCSGKTLTNGLQILTGSCNGIVMGDIPAKTTMISSIIVNPQNGQTIASGKDFNITVQVKNLQAGAFTNADATYYAAPQQLNSAGQVIGHTHVTVQDLGNSLNPSNPPDPTQFAFFKGINDAGNGQGLLSATVSGGLPPGNYRLCTLTSSANHQPVIMPVAQRGSQDDCTKFTVNGNDDTTNVAANDGSKGQAAAAAAASAVAAGPGAITTGDAGATATTDAAAATSSSSSSAAAKGNTGGKGANGKGPKGKVAADTTTSAAATTTTSSSAKGSATTATAKATSSDAAASKGGSVKGDGQRAAGQGRGQGRAASLIRLTRREFVA